MRINRSVNGRWTNFVPPIQGGHFRRFYGEDLEDTDYLGSEGSSELISGPSSPIFDSLEDEKPGLRRRKSTSTVSSAISPTPALPDSQEPHLCVLDARTQQEIMLDKVKYPPVDARHQDHTTQKYRALNKRIQDEGLYNCNYSAYAVEILRYSILFALFVLCLHHAYFGFAGLFLGCFWHQLVFTAHDAGHMGITHTTSRLTHALAFSSETSSGDSVWAGGNAATTSTIS